MNFERIDDYRARAKIPGGWLVETVLYDDTGTIPSISICFVPDSKHEWNIAIEED